FISASLKHYSPEIADVVFDADLYKEVQAANAPAVDPAPAEPANPEQPAQTASKLGAFLDILKKMSPVFAIGTVGAGFWGSGAIPGVANLVSNIIGVTIPMVGTAGIISQVAIAAAVGALAYGAALGAWTVGKAAYNAGSTALANRKAAKSAKAQYEADKSAAAKDVSDLEKALGYDEQNALVAKLSALVSKAPDAVFGEDDNLAADDAQPKGLTQLQVLQKEKQLLADIKAANDAKDEAKRQELEAKVAKRGFKFSS
ncbi:MAG: hypothetical protein AB7R69_06330, partial [Candidatus Babeliales bacterium]